jgi:penicillin-binding protein 2
MIGDDESADCDCDDMSMVMMQVRDPDSFVEKDPCGAWHPMVNEGTSNTERVMPIQGSWRLSFFILFCWLPIAQGESDDNAGSTPQATATPSPTGASSLPPNLRPSWETQKTAATYTLSIPAPRGQITDRHGVPLAQTRISHNLSIRFPTPLDFTDAQVIEFANKEVDLAKALTTRDVGYSQTQLLQHYHNRGVIPFDIATNLSEDEAGEIQKHPQAGLVLTSVYVRTYPQKACAGLVVGYTGRNGRPSTKSLQNNELLWPDCEGREGLEQTFNTQLTGKPGQLVITFDSNHEKTGERIVAPPTPGQNLVSTLDIGMQHIAEQVLAKRAKRGAIVVTDPNTGEILVLASWPTIDPNEFVPTISAEKFRQFEKDPNIPLLPRAYRSAYPPGSTFKVFMGLAGFESQKLDPDDTYDCSPSFSIGNLTFHNWKKRDAGELNFVGALTQSCNTWFYQFGLKLGAEPMVTWAQRLGLGKRTGILLNGEAPGRIPTEPYMQSTYHRRFLPGDLANFSIGQGDILISPLQMAQAMGTIANGGTLYQMQIAKQLQNINNEVTYDYQPRAKDFLHLRKVTLRELREGMVAVVSGGNGTAHSAEIDDVDIAGKTGTAQWGPKDHQRYAAWFAGFLPAQKPKYAFAAVYEGSPDEKAHGGAKAAPMIGQFFRQLYKGEKVSKPSDEGSNDESD